jgi:hypothetical protein
MPVYVADSYLPGITLEQVTATQRAAMEASRRFTADGKPVRYLRSVFVPSESHCLSLFEAPDARRVQEVNEVARIPFTRIVEALDLSP